MEIERLGLQGPRPAASDALNEQAGVRQIDSIQKDRLSRTEADRSQPAATIDISERARELSRVYQTVASAPEVRADRVAALRKQIDEGTYTVASEKLAEKLLRSGVLDE